MLRLQLKNQYKGKAKTDTKLAKAILKANKIPEIKTKKNKIVDDLILDTVDKDNFVVATMDAELKRKLKKLGIPRVVIRQKKYLFLLL